MCNADNQMQNIILAGDGVVICVQPVATMTELHINFRWANAQLYTNIFICK